MIRSLLLSAFFATAVQAGTLPSREQVDAQAVKCRLDPGQVAWRPGERQIVAIFVMSVSEDEADAEKARASGACLEAWTKSLGFHPVITVQIPEGH